MSRKTSLFIVLAIAITPRLLATPQLASIDAGSATIATTPTATNVTQTSHSASLTWKSFNLTEQQSITFSQPSSQSLAINHITDQNPSTIHGTITANGRIILLNANGFFFGKTASISANTFIAAATTLSNSSISSNHFSILSNHRLTGNITNHATIHAHTVKLYASTITHTGSASTIPHGAITLRAHKNITISGTLTSPQGSIDIFATNGRTQATPSAHISTTITNYKPSHSPGFIEFSGKSFDFQASIFSYNPQDTLLLDPENIIIRGGGYVNLMACAFSPTITCATQLDITMTGINNIQDPSSTTTYVFEGALENISSGTIALQAEKSITADASFSGSLDFNNNVNFSLETTSTSSGEGDIDLSNITGGITLTGTGDLTITATGDITLPATVSATNIALHSSSATASAGISLTAANNVILPDTVTANSIEISAGGTITSSQADAVTFYGARLRSQSGSADSIDLTAGSAIGSASDIITIESAASGTTTLSSFFTLSTTGANPTLAIASNYSDIFDVLASHVVSRSLASATIIAHTQSGSITLANSHSLSATGVDVVLNAADSINLGNNSIVASIISLTAGAGIVTQTLTTAYHLTVDGITFDVLGDIGSTSAPLRHTGSSISAWSATNYSIAFTNASQVYLSTNLPGSLLTTFDPAFTGAYELTQSAFGGSTVALPNLSLNTGNLALIYTGANTNINLGANTITAGSVLLDITGNITNGVGGGINAPSVTLNAAGSNGVGTQSQMLLLKNATTTLSGSASSGEFYATTSTAGSVVVESIHSPKVTILSTQGISGLNGTVSPNITSDIIIVSASLGTIGNSIPAALGIEKTNGTWSSSSLLLTSPAASSIYLVDYSGGALDATFMAGTLSSGGAFWLRQASGNLSVNSYPSFSSSIQLTLEAASGILTINTGISVSNITLIGNGGIVKAGSGTVTSDSITLESSTGDIGSASDPIDFTCLNASPCEWNSSSLVLNPSGNDIYVTTDGLNPHNFDNTSLGITYAGTIDIIQTAGDATFSQNINLPNATFVLEIASGDFNQTADITFRHADITAHNFYQTGGAIIVDTISLDTGGSGIIGASVNYITINNKASNDLWISTDFILGAAAIYIETDTSGVLASIGSPPADFTLHQTKGNIVIPSGLPTYTNISINASSTTSGEGNISNSGNNTITVSGNLELVASGTQFGIGGSISPLIIERSDANPWDASNLKFTLSAGSAVYIQTTTTGSLDAIPLSFAGIFSLLQSSGAISIPSITNSGLDLIVVARDASNDIVIANDLSLSSLTLTSGKDITSASGALSIAATYTISLTATASATSSVIITSSSSSIVADIITITAQDRIDSTTQLSVSNFLTLTANSIGSAGSLDITNTAGNWTASTTLDGYDSNATLIDITTDKEGGLLGLLLSNIPTTIRLTQTTGQIIIPTLAIPNTALEVTASDVTNGAIELSGALTTSSIILGAQKDITFNAALSSDSATLSTPDTITSNALGSIASDSIIIHATSFGTVTQLLSVERLTAGDWNANDITIGTSINLTDFHVSTSTAGLLALAFPSTLTDFSLQKTTGNIDVVNHTLPVPLSSLSLEASSTAADEGSIIRTPDQNNLVAGTLTAGAITLIAVGSIGTSIGNVIIEKPSGSFDAASLSLTTGSSGDIYIETATQDVVFASMSGFATGSFSLTQTTGDITVSSGHAIPAAGTSKIEFITLNGEIVITDTLSSNALTITSSSGGITIGNTANITATNGAITVTANGNITIDDSSTVTSVNDALSITSSNGDIAIDNTTALTSFDTLTLHANQNIVFGTDATLDAPTITLQSTSGNSGIGSSSNPVGIATTGITNLTFMALGTSGSAYLTAADDLAIHTSSAGDSVSITSMGSGGISNTTTIDPETNTVTIDSITGTSIALHAVNGTIGSEAVPITLASHLDSFVVNDSLSINSGVLANNTRSVYVDLGDADLHLASEIGGWAGDDANSLLLVMTTGAITNDPGTTITTSTPTITLVAESISTYANPISFEFTTTEEITVILEALGNPDLADESNTYDVNVGTITTDTNGGSIAIYGDRAEKDDYSTDLFIGSIGFFNSIEIDRVNKLFNVNELERSASSSYDSAANYLERVNTVNETVNFNIAYSSDTSQSQPQLKITTDEGVGTENKPLFIDYASINDVKNQNTVVVSSVNCNTCDYIYVAVDRIAGSVEDHYRIQIQTETLQALGYIFIDLGEVVIPLFSIILRFYEEVQFDAASFKDVANYSVEDNALKSCPDQSFTKDEYDMLESQGVPGCEVSYILGKKTLAFLFTDLFEFKDITQATELLTPTMVDSPIPEGAIVIPVPEEQGPVAPTAAPATSPGQ